MHPGNSPASRKDFGDKADGEQQPFGWTDASGHRFALHPTPDCALPTAVAEIYRATKGECRSFEGAAR